MRFAGVLSALATSGVLLLVFSLAAAPGAPGKVSAGSHPAPPSPATPQGPAAPVAPNSFHSTTSGLDLTLPEGWFARDGVEMINRRQYRYFVVGKEGTDVAPTVQGNADWTQVTSDRIRLELQAYALPGGGSPDTETQFPLGWTAAQLMPPQGEFVVKSLSFQNLLRPFTLVAHIGAQVAPSDAVELAAIVASIRPEPLPPSGEYRGWDVLGPVDLFPIGAVRHFDPIAPGVGGFYLVRGARSIFALIDHTYLFMAAIRPCAIRYDDQSRTFVCDATGDRWSRVGRQLLTETSWFNLGRHGAIVKDGVVLVGGSTSSASRVDDEETAEFPDPVIAPDLLGPRIPRTEVIARYAMITATEPMLRSAAKLVSVEALARSQFIRGAIAPVSMSAPLWVVAFSGEVRTPPGFELSGRWAVFLVDPRTGGLVNAACCEGGGDWPPGFDALPDIAGEP